MGKDETAELFDNKTGMEFDKALLLIESFFQKELPHFKVVEKYSRKDGFWGIKYLHGDLTVFLGCQMGYIDIEIQNSIREAIVEFEPLINNIEVASEKNIKFFLSVIKRLVTQI